MPPVIPALVAFAGAIGGLFSLTLGQDPSNALPHWSPASGWGLGLGSLALASVLVWIGLVRRRCPDCGSSQMLDAMEEESVLASERLGAEKAAVAAARVEAPPQSSRDKEIGDRLAAREQELRSTLEQELRTRLVRELEPQIEHNLRGRLEQELRATLGHELKGESEKSRTQMQKALRLQIEYEVRKEVEQRLRAEYEQQSVTPAPIIMAKPVTASVTPKVVTPPPSTTARAFTSTSAPQSAVGAAAPRPASPSAAKEVTPSPLKPFSVKPLGPAPLSPAAVKPTTPAASAVMKTAQPAAPHAKVDTAPLSLLSSPGKATIIGLKAAVVPVQAAPQKPASSVVAPGSDHPAPGKDPGSNEPNG